MRRGSEAALPFRERTPEALPDFVFTEDVDCGVTDCVPVPVSGRSRRRLNIGGLHALEPEQRRREGLPVPLRDTRDHEVAAQAVVTPLSSE